MKGHTFIKGWVIAILACIIPTQIISKDTDEFVRLTLVGNLDSYVMPDETTRIIVTAEAHAPGVLELRINGLRPPFVAGWDSKKLTCIGQRCTIVDTLVVQPTRLDYGEYSFNVFATLKLNGNLVEEQSRRVRLRVIPRLQSKPPYSAGVSTELCWAPVEQGFDYEIVRVSSPNLAGSQQSASTFGNSTVLDSCQVVTGLTEGVRYGYFVRATTPRGLTLSSNTVYTVQDQSPPPSVQPGQFTVDENGAVTLPWQLVPDEISFIRRYVVFRRQVNIGGAFAAIDTIPFFPASEFDPPNYYPAKAERGAGLYVDNGEPIFATDAGKVFKIEKMPDFLTSAAMIKTAMQDRWNEEDEFLSFNLEVASLIYIAFDFDNRNTSAPDWLQAGFEQTTTKIQATDGKLRLFKSRSVVPAGRVTLGGNFATGIGITRKQPMMYSVFILPADQVLPYASGDRFDYVDRLGAENDLNTFRYKVSTTDAVGHIVDGAESPLVIVDLNGHCKPNPSGWFAFEGPSGVRYSRGLSNQVCIQDPLSDLNCAGFRDTDSLRFQAARASASLFANRQPDALGTDFFDSGWVAAADLPVSNCYSFDLLPTGQAAEFVDGSQYFYQVRAKDRHGNFSVWSNVVDAVQDVFPPTDVTNLSVASVRFDAGSEGCNQLSWQGADDQVSGIRSYVIYRKDALAGAQYVAIDSISGTETGYCDLLSEFTSNRVVFYKVGSIDNVGNARTADASDQEVQIQALVGPTIRFDTTQVFFCDGGQSRITSDSITVFWEGFNTNDLQGYETEVERPNAPSVRRVFFDPGLVEVASPLDAGDGIYKIRVRAFYSNQDTTIFSNTITVRRKVRLESVQNLVAEQDSEPTGNIQLTWFHPDMFEIDRFEVFTWKEGEPQSDVPTAVLDGDATSWVHDFERDGLVGYQCNSYTIRAFDCFGLVSEIDPVVMQYSNHPPVFDKDRTAIGFDRITVFWDRPTPRVLENDAFDAIIMVRRDSRDAAPIGTDTLRNQTSYTLVNPDTLHNYFFEVKEVIKDDLNQMCASEFESGFSGMIVVPFKNLPPTVPFDVQALPVTPGSATGRVFVAWQDTIAAANAFEVQYTTKGEMAKSDTILVLDADTLLVPDLPIADNYSFRVIAIDTLGQRSRTSNLRDVGFSPPWVFTPRVMGFTPECFRESVTVTWGWLNEDLVPVDSSFGADSVVVQLSVDPAFGEHVTETSLSLRRQHTFNRIPDYEFVDESNVQLYARIRAKDKWQHASPWSTTYDVLGRMAGNYDTVPPEPVTCHIDSVKAPIFGDQGEVNVHLSWDQAPDNCSGTWFYEIMRNDSLIATDTSSTRSHTYIDRGLRNDEPFLALEWRVNAVDSVGNKQPVAVGCRVPFRVSAPDSGWCQNDTTFCWNSIAENDNGLPVRYFVEGARFVSLLGNKITNVTAGPLDTTCYEFDVPWDGIYWRIKARTEHIESAWSDTFFCDLSGSGLAIRFGFDPQNILPREFALNQNYPNPFNPSTTIRYGIPMQADGAVRVVLEIFNVAGQRVRTLVDKEQGPSFYSVVWDGRDDGRSSVGSGVYFYRIRANNFVASRKLMFVK